MSAVRVLVIGAGPAGCAAAIGLRRRGFEVVIIEAREFPRVKVCGEFVSPAATRILEDLIGAPRLASLGARRVASFVLELGAAELTWPLARPGWALSRAELDSALLDAARRAGASVEQPVSVMGMGYRPDGVSARLADGRVVEADFVVHADGAGRHDPEGPTPMRRGVLAHKCHFRPAPDASMSGVRIRCARGAYVGTMRVEGGLAVCALVARTSLVRRSGGDADTLLREVWPAFDPAWRVGPWKASGVAASGFIDPGHARSFRVGNAAAAVEPVGGEGIGLGLWSGGALAEVFDAAHPRTAQRRFARRYRQRILLRRPACRLAAAALVRPALVRSAWPLLRRGVGSRAWMALTGKPVRFVHQRA